MFFPIIFFFVCFNNIHNFCINEYKITLDDLNKITSTTHAVIVSFGAVLYLLNNLSIFYFNYFLYFSCGFAIYDVVNLFLINYRQKYELTLHHSIILFGSIYCISENFSK